MFKTQFNKYINTFSISPESLEKKIIIGRKMFAYLSMF